MQIMAPLQLVGTCNPCTSLACTLICSYTARHRLVSISSIITRGSSAATTTCTGSAHQEWSQYGAGQIGSQYGAGRIGSQLTGWSSAVNMFCRLMSVWFHLVKYRWNGDISWSRSYTSCGGT